MTGAVVVVVGGCIRHTGRRLSILAEWGSQRVAVTR